MNKKELFDALDGFSQNLLVTLAEVEAIKKNLKQVIEENTALRLENDKLRERLGKLRRLHPQSPNTMVVKICNVFTMTVFIFALIPTVNAVRTMKSVCFVTSCYLGSKHADPTKF